MLTNLFGLLPGEVEQELAPSYPKYRSKQLLAWLYKAMEADPAKMTNLPADFKTHLSTNYSLFMPQIQSQRKSRDGSIKYLLKLEDGKLIECVLIPEPKKHTLCISTQVGCARGCAFCSTAKMKLTRNLEVHEIIGQIIVAAKELQAVGSLAKATTPPSVESFQPSPTPSLSPNSKAERTTHDSPPPSVESFQPSPTLNLSPNSKAERTTHDSPPPSVESFQPSPTPSLSPNSKAERTTHDSLHPLPSVVHVAAKIETAKQISKAISTPDLTKVGSASHPTPHITNLVFMGMGEPFDNQENVFKALQIIQSESGLSLSPRRITISTCGVVPGIISLADSGIKAKLAISLNAATDEKRTLLMPINKKYPLTQLKQALLYYLRISKFRVTIEYILIPEVNMGADDLKALRKFVGDISCKINFIPFNPGKNSPFQAPTPEQIETFMHKAQTLPQAIMLRKSRGADILGACGQLVINKTLGEELCS